VITFGPDNKNVMLNGKTEKESSLLSGFYYPSAREVASIQPLEKFIPDSRELFPLENNPEQILS
jgi:hypothetical protein